ncbi:hypothetical protein OXX79_004196 [Metschnikowia pulcherrima]
MWLVKVLFGLKSILTRAHLVLTDYSPNFPVFKPDHALQGPGQASFKRTLNVPGNMRYSSHPSISRFYWQISGSTTVCVPVDFERSKDLSILNSTVNDRREIVADRKELDSKAAENMRIEMAALADELFSSVANVFSPPFFAATDLVVEDTVDFREATQIDSDKAIAENVTDEFADSGDDIGSDMVIAPQNFIPISVEGEIGLHEDPDLWRSISPTMKAPVGRPGINWQAKDRNRGASKVDLASEVSRKTSTTDVTKVSPITGMQHAMGSVHCKNSFWNFAETDCCMYQDNQEQNPIEFADDDSLFSKARENKTKASVKRYARYKNCVTASSRFSSPIKFKYAKRRRSWAPVLNKRHTKKSAEMKQNVLHTGEIFKTFCEYYRLVAPIALDEESAIKASYELLLTFALSD